MSNPIYSCAYREFIRLRAEFPTLDQTTFILGFVRGYMNKDDVQKKINDWTDSIQDGNEVAVHPDEEAFSQIEQPSIPA